MTDLPTQPVSPQERQGTVDRLCRHYTLDHLETDEFERRLDLAYAARSSGELVALVRDLPELRPEGAPAQGGAAAAPSPVTRTRIDPTLPIAERDFMLAIMGGTERTGSWTPPRRLAVLSLMGGTALDFREATFASDEVHVSVVAVLGGAEIIVPPGVHVECSGVAIMGGFASSESKPGAPGAPVLRISGFAFMGGVEIKERLPGETEREARRRLKADRKARRRGALPPGTEG